MVLFVDCAWHPLFINSVWFAAYVSQCFSLAVFQLLRPLQEVLPLAWGQTQQSGSLPRAHDETFTMRNSWQTLEVNALGMHAKLGSLQDVSFRHRDYSQPGEKFGGSQSPLFPARSSSASTALAPLACPNLRLGRTKAFPVLLPVYRQVRGGSFLNADLQNQLLSIGKDGQSVSFRMNDEHASPPKSFFHVPLQTFLKLAPSSPLWLLCRKCCRAFLGHIPETWEHIPSAISSSHKLLKDCRHL